MDHFYTTYFSQEKQISIMEGYEEYKKIITAKCNTVTANMTREECWQKIADCVNL